MNFCVRMMSFVALLGTTLIGLSQYRPAWAARAGLDWWSLPELCEEYRHGEQELAAQEAQGRGMVERLRARGEVIDDLRAGRLTLVQAAARFRGLNGLAPEASYDLSHHMAGATEEERLCRQVIYWAEGAERTVPPTAREQTRRCLEAELDRLLAENNGVIRLQE
jgi:hypothetical protein